MKSYQILEHTADLKIKAFGRTKKELFLNMVLAMEQVLRPKIKSPSEKIKRRIKIKSDNLNLLLVDFLSEVNYLSEINFEVYNKIKLIEFSDTFLEADLTGKKVSSFGIQIKGVTCHNLEIRQKKDKAFEATILFDI